MTAEALSIALLLAITNVFVTLATPADFVNNVQEDFTKNSQPGDMNVSNANVIPAVLSFVTNKEELACAKRILKENAVNSV